MNQKQKDTIREELEITVLGLYESIKAECPHCVDEHSDKILNFIFNKLDQAYKSGAKDKVEEVLKAIKKVNKLSYKELRPFERNWYQHAIQTITKIIKR